MSGLSAIAHWDHTPIDPTTTDHMTRAAPHRGHPTTHTTTHAHLTHHTHHPQRPPQPHTHHHLTITASARIDNRNDLQHHLQRHLTTPNPTDTQLILAAHHHWGPNAPHHLIGDYAYVILDHTTHTLHAARDPMGMRPLYYHHTPTRTLIASEANQILAVPGVARRLYEPMVAAFLAGPYGRDEWTFFAGINRLAPGHALEVDANGARTRRFWDIDPEHREHHPHEHDYAERFRELFLQAVDDRLRTTGTHGLLLSGGVDSGSIAATAGYLLEHGHPSPPIRTYSWAFDELTAGDERATSARITDRFRLPAVAVPADDAWPLAGYPDHGPDPDDPFLNVYQALMDRSLGLAADDGVVSLWSGDRGDPLVGDGIFDHVGAARAGRLGLLLRELRAHARWSKRSVARTVRSHLVRPLLEALGSRPPVRLDPTKAVPPFMDVEFVRRTGLVDTIADEVLPPSGRDRARAARSARLFRFRGLLDPVPQERRRARYGLALVDPWADRRLVEFVLATPQWLVQRPSEPKRLARLALHGILPTDVIAALGKTEPVDLFSRGWYDRSRETIRALLTDMRAAELGYVDERVLRASYEADLAGRRSRFDLWWAISFEVWLRSHHM
jgi:asparagine synthase (glutamine-hydrolysing)